MSERDGRDGGPAGPRLGRPLRGPARIRGARPGPRPDPDRGAGRRTSSRPPRARVPRARPAAFATMASWTRRPPGRRLATGWRWSPSTASAGPDGASPDPARAAAADGGDPAFPGRSADAVAGARGERRRRLRRDLGERRVQRPPPRALHHRRVGIRRAAGGAAVEGGPRGGSRGVPVRRRRRPRPASRSIAGLGCHGRGPRGACARTLGRENRRVHRLVGRRQVSDRQRARRRAAARHRGDPRGRRARPAHDHAPPARPARRTACSSTPRACASSASSTATGVATAFEDVERVASTCRFCDCGHRSEPGCAVRAAIADGTLDPGRFEAWRKLQREAERAAHRDGRARAPRGAKEVERDPAERHQHMRVKYGTAER